MGCVVIVNQVRLALDMLRLDGLLDFLEKLSILFFVCALASHEYRSIYQTVTNCPKQCNTTETFIVDCSFYRLLRILPRTLYTQSRIERGLIYIYDVGIVTNQSC